jgi:uncharacterized protein YhfF
LASLINQTAFYQKAKRLCGLSDDTLLHSWHFGDNAMLADFLLDEVLKGKKTGTASLLWEYEADAEPLPKEGDYSIITSFSGQPQALIRTCAVSVVAFNAVDSAFALSENLSLQEWRRTHWEYFSKRCAVIGKTMTPDAPVICETFEVMDKATS